MPECKRLIKIKRVLARGIACPEFYFENDVMPADYTQDYLLNKRIAIFQPLNGYRASTDAVMLAAMVSKVKNAKILDVGSGTGAVSLCLAERFKHDNVKIDGLELQPKLAELANLSARANNFDFLQFHNRDVGKKETAKEFIPCSYDIVVSNPPYSDHDMPSPNSSKATAHNLSTADFENWLSFCLKMAKPFGKIFMINRVEALPKICALVQGKAGGLRILPIYSKKGQSAKRIIVEMQKDSKSPCKILPSFLVHSESGEYSASAEKILREGHSFTDIFSQ